MAHHGGLSKKGSIMRTRIMRWVLLGALLIILVAGGIHRTVVIAGDSGDRAVGSDGYGAGAYGAGQTTIRATEWAVAEGTVSRVSTSILVIDTASHGRLIVEGQSWAYAQSQGFTAQVSDQIVVTGFDEADELKAGSLHNESTGHRVRIRDDNGWPYWSMRYQRER
jgi:hypothetical protein